jgi:excisionase family DNA binding protein
MDIETEDEFQLLTVRDVAKMLRLSESKIRDMQQAGRLPYMKIGGSVRFDQLDMLEYLKQRKHIPRE